MDRIDMASAHPAPFGFGIADVALPAPAFTLPRQVADDLDLTVEPNVESTIPQITNGVLWKIVLPKRPGESRLAPLQYYYPASRTGVLPTSHFA
jgi:hypothetical protein